MCLGGVQYPPGCSRPQLADMTRARGFDWSYRYLLGYPSMDNIHWEFVERVDALLVADDEQVPAALNAFIVHAQEHFRQEREWMLNSDFPATECHVVEHEKVMASVVQVRARVKKGETDIARQLARELVKWFPAHANYMDSALAQWMSRRAFGGVPVVVRRKDAAATSSLS